MSISSLKLDKGESRDTDLLGILLGVKAVAGASESLALLRVGCVALGAVHTTSCVLASLVVHRPFLSNSHLLTVIVIHSMATAQRHLENFPPVLSHVGNIHMFNQHLSVCGGPGSMHNSGDTILISVCLFTE